MTISAHPACTIRFLRGVAQPGSALAWGARGREFESRRPDQYTRKRKPRPLAIFLSQNGRANRPHTPCAMWRLQVALTDRPKRTCDRHIGWTFRQRRAQKTACDWVCQQLAATRRCPAASRPILVHSLSVFDLARHRTILNPNGAHARQRREVRCPIGNGTTATTRVASLSCRRPKMRGRVKSSKGEGA